MELPVPAGRGGASATGSPGANGEDGSTGAVGSAAARPPERAGQGPDGQQPEEAPGAGWFLAGGMQPGYLSGSQPAWRKCSYIQTKSRLFLLPPDQ
jgi:hypothetical protein